MIVLEPRGQCGCPCIIIYHTAIPVPQKMLNCKEQVPLKPMTSPLSLQRGTCLLKRHRSDSSVHDCSTNTSERELFKIAQLTVRRQLSFLESESSALAHALPLFCKSLCKLLQRGVKCLQVMYDSSTIRSIRFYIKTDHACTLHNAHSLPPFENLAKHFIVQDNALLYMYQTA